MDKKTRVSCTVNGRQYELLINPRKTLLEIIREDIGLTGTKHGCELGECGTCTILVDGEPVLSCLAIGLDYDGCNITTIEGVEKDGDIHPLQKYFAEYGAAQCGYCTPGIILVAKKLLDSNPKPTRQEITKAISGNLCRCTGYIKIFEAIESAASELNK
ncbi:MAG: (2Fe-2S)-binding protein [Planctomycetes bacterium]|nr:(2Fe-2S)-binding protein [Planctomycetota bacterium]